MTTAPAERQRMKLPLDPLQKGAAEAPVGPVVIMGGPGSGKTHTILGRIGSLMEGGANPSTITCLTFSSRSADQIREKLGEVFTEEALVRRIFVGTFHHFASMFLRQAGASRINRSPHFTLWDQDQAFQVITTFIEQNSDNFALTPKEVNGFLHWLSLNRASWVKPPIPADDATWYQLLDLYEEAKQKQNTMDLDDLTPLAVKAMEADPKVRAFWNNIRTRHLIIDEFQDITPIQYRLIELITGPDKSVTIATDPNQAIYGWRGSDTGLLEQFRINHPTSEIHLLRLNHRSTATLVKLATTLTGEETMEGLNNDYQRAIRPEGPPPEIIQVQGGQQDLAKHILSMAQDRVNDGSREWTDMALIYRRSRILNPLITNLMAAGIPYHILGESKKPGQTTTQRIINLLTCLLNPMDAAAFVNAASVEKGETRRGLNRETARRIAGISQEMNINLIQASEEYLPRLKMNVRTRHNLEYVTWAWEMLHNYIEEEGSTLPELCHLACRLAQTKQKENLQEGINQQTTYLMSLSRTMVRMPRETLAQQTSRFLETIKASVHPDLQEADADDVMEQQKGITLATIHSAKGLQWKTVWVVDASDGAMPGNRSNAAEHIQEEQRIFYVASTRATDNLYYCYATEQEQEKGEETKLTRFLDTVRQLIEFQEA